MGEMGSSLGHSIQASPLKGILASSAERCPSYMGRKGAFLSLNTSEEKNPKRLH